MTLETGTTVGEQSDAASAQLDMEARLRVFVAEQMGPGAVVERVVDTSGGRSRQNWAFDVVPTVGPVQRLILRRDPAGGLVETDRRTEFAVLAALGETPVPAPVARWIDDGGQWFGRPSLVMERAPGSCDYRILNGARPAPERRALAEDLCALLVQVHAVDWTPLVDAGVLSDPGPQAGAAAIDEWEAVLRRDQVEAQPEIDLALAALRERAPTSPTRVLVHGDYKPGNVLIDDGRITALLDWELAHVGDPCEDLGWMIQPLRRREQLIEGAWEEGDLLDGYERRSGRSVDRAAVRWWAAFATLRTAVMQVSGLRSFLEGRSAPPYRPTGRVLRTLVDQACGGGWPRGADG